MLYMCFYIGEVRYAIQARSIESLIPRVNLQPCTELNDKQCGNLIYKQQLLPVFDLCQVLLNRQAESALSTRILLLSNDADNSTLCGIIVERATGTIRLDKAADKQQQNSEGSSLTNTLHTNSHGTLQLINPARLVDMLLGTTELNSSQRAGTFDKLQAGSV